MKKALVISALIICFMWVFSLPSLAEDFDDIKKAVPQEAEEILGNTNLDSNTDFSKLWGKLTENIKNLFTGQIKAGISLVLSITAISLISYLAVSVFGDGGTGVIALAEILTVMAVTMNGTKAAISSSAQAVEDIYGFSSTLLPVLASATASLGGITSSSTKLMASTLAINIFTSIQINIVIPLIYCYIALSAASAVLPGPIKSGAKLIKWAINTVLTGSVTVFTLYITISGVITSTADSLTVKVTKTAISNLIPVVGKIISDAAESVASGFSVIRAVSGAFGVVVVTACMLGPWIKGFVQYISFKLSATICQSISGSALGAFVSDLGTAMGLVLASAASSAVMLYVAIIAFLRVVNGV